MDLFDQVPWQTRIAFLDIASRRGMQPATLLTMALQIYIKRTREEQAVTLSLFEEDKQSDL